MEICLLAAQPFSYNAGVASGQFESIPSRKKSHGMTNQRPTQEKQEQGGEEESDGESKAALNKSKEDPRAGHTPVRPMDLRRRGSVRVVFLLPQQLPSPSPALHALRPSLRGRTPRSLAGLRAMPQRLRTRNVRLLRHERIQFRGAGVHFSCAGHLDVRGRPHRGVVARALPQANPHPRVSDYASPSFCCSRFVCNCVVVS